MLEMKKIVFAFILLSFVQTVFGQEKPLTQTEYVRMLYTLEKAPAKKDEVLDALRSRGIAFVLTDGLRGLTRTKSANNDEIKRALEEAERRRQDPVATKMPTAIERGDIIEKTRFNTNQALGEMPDFVVKQLISRSEAFAGTGNWKTYSNLVIGVSYSTEKGEQYRVLVKDGAPVVDTTAQSSYSGLDGATSGGEFVEDLKKIFDPASKTTFDLLTTDFVRGRRTVVFNYEIDISNNKKGGIGLKGPVYSSSPAGEKGRIWIDRDSFRILRIEYQATNIEPNFPVKAVTKSIEYDMIEISGEKFLLPTISDFRGTVESSGRRFEQRNVIRFKNYQKYGTDIIILDDDVKAEPELEVKKP